MIAMQLSYKFSDMKTLGTDVSLKVCRQEGYLMVRFDARKKFDVSEYYNVFAYYPEWITENVYKGQKMLDVEVSFNDLVKTYKSKYKEINSFADTDQCVNFENPTIYDLLNLASDINSYCGL